MTWIITRKDGPRFMSEDPSKTQPEWGQPGEYTVEPYVPSQAEATAMAIVAVQQRLDALAQSWGYDDIKSGATYAGDPYPRFNAEGTAMRNWRSATWAAVDEHRDAKSLDELLGYLPPVPNRPA